MIAINKEQEPLDNKQFTQGILSNELVAAHWKASAFDELYSHYRSLLEHQLRVFEPDHPDLISTYQNLGVVCVRKEDYQLGVEYQRKARRISLSEKAQADYQLAFTYDLLGISHAENKEYDQALECFDVALKGFRSLQAQDKISGCYNNIGETLRRKGEFDDAIGYLEEALEMAKQLFGKHDEKTAMTHGNLGKLHVQKGDFEKGLSYLREAERIFLECRDPQHPNVKKARQWIARAKKAQAKAASAKGSK